MYNQERKQVMDIAPLIQQRAEAALSPLRAIDALRRASLDLASFESLAPVAQLLLDFQRCKDALVKLSKQGRDVG